MRPSKSRDRLVKEKFSAEQLTRWARRVDPQCSRRQYLRSRLRRKAAAWPRATVADAKINTRVSR